MLKKPQMIDYIYEQQAVLMKIFDNRKTITAPVIDLFKRNEIKRIFLIGTGSSYHAALVGQQLFARWMDVEATVTIPTTFTNYEKINANQVYEKQNILVLAISQGGKSSSTINAIKKAHQLGIHSLAATSNLDSPITEHASSTVLIDCGEEKVPPETKGYTATLLTLMLCIIEVSYLTGNMNDEEYKKFLRGLEQAIENYDDNIRATEKWYQENKDQLIEAQKFTIVGYGLNTPTIQEGTLKIYETVRRPTTSYELEEFLHGPYMAVDKESHIFYIAHESLEKERMCRVVNELSTKTSHQYGILDKDGKDCFRNSIRINTTKIDEFCALEFVPSFQVIAYYLSSDLGIDTTMSAYPGFSQKIGTKVS